MLSHSVYFSMVVELIIMQFLTCAHGSRGVKKIVTKRQYPSAVARKPQG